MRPPRLILAVALAAAVFAPAAGQEPCRAARGKDDKGVTVVTMENAFLKLTLRPSGGGMMTSVKHKRTGHEFVGGAQGFFMDLDWSIPRQADNDYHKQDYACEATEETAEQVTVTLKGKSLLPPLDWIYVTRAMTLKRRSAAIYARVTYHNHPDSMSTIPVRPWVHHEGEGFGSDAVFVMPLRSGRHAFSPQAGRASSKYGSDPAEGWEGFFKPGAQGLAAHLEIKELHQFYQWASDRVGTIEWRMGPYEIKNGESREVGYVLLPFWGMNDLSGGADGVACGIVTPAVPEKGKPAACAVELVSGEAREGVRVEVLARHQGDGVWKTLGAKTCRLEPDAVARLDFDPWTPDRPGTWVVQARVKADGRRFFDAERALVVEKTTEGYELAQASPRPADANLIADPSVEWGVVDGWELKAAAVDTSTAHAGRACIRLEGPGSSAVSRPVPVTPKSAYNVSLWVKSPKASVTVAVEERDAAGAVLAAAKPAVEVKEPSDEWRRVAFQHAASPQAATARVAAQAGPGATGPSWVDDVFFSPGEPPRPTHPAQTDVPYTIDIETPHIRWARPYARGPLKAFLLCHYDHARDVIELAQRFEMDFHTVTWSGSSLYCAYASGDMYGKRRAEDEVNNVRDKLAQKYDVIVLGGIPWKWFPVQVRGRILKQVAEGAGLVYVQPVWLLDDLLNPKGCDEKGFPAELREVAAEFPVKFPGDANYRHLRDGLPAQRSASHPITDGMPFAAWFPVRYGNYGLAGQTVATLGKKFPLISLGRFGEGRVAVLNYVTGPAWPYGKDAVQTGRAWNGLGLFPFETASKGFDPATARYPYWEYVWPVVARATAWAGRREPTVAVLGITPDAGVEMPKGPCAAVELKVQSPEAMQGKAHVTFRDEGSVVLGQTEQPLALAAQEPRALRFDAPADAPGGRVFVEIILRDGQGRSLNWAVTAFDNPKPARIEAVEFDRDPAVYRRGEEVKAKVKLAGDFAGGRLDVRVEDTWDRLLLSRSEAAQAETPLSLRLDHPRSVRAAVRAELRLQGRLVDRAEQRFTISPDKSPWDQYQFIISSVRAGSRMYLFPHCYRHYAKFGFTAVRGHHALENADNNFQFLASVGGLGKVPEKAAADWARYLQNGDATLLRRDPPIYDPNEWDRAGKSFEDSGRRYAQVAPLIYGLGDENNIGGGECDYDYSPATLAWFRKWLGERYGSLDALNRQWETNFHDWDSVMPMPLPAARQRGQNLSPWADHREFMDYVFAEYFARRKAAIRRGDPNAVVGTSGTQVPDAYNGYDWWRLMKVFDALLAYSGGSQPEIQRSFKRVPSVGWAGYGSVGPRNHHQLWRYLLFNKTASLWRDTCVFEPDWRPSQSCKDYAEAARPLLQGSGKLVMDSAWIPSAVGIHYSQASIRAAAAEKRAAAFEQARAGWITLLNDLGLHPFFVSYEQVEKGELGPARLRAFILPESSAISPAEADRLRAYVEAGGMLIADALAARRDDHCRLLSEPALDGFFGVRNGPPPAERPPRRIDLRDADWLRWPVKQMMVNPSPYGTGLQTTAGQALGDSRGVPSFVWRAVGKGRAVFLNLHSTVYPRGQADGDAFRDNIGALFEAAGVRAPVQALNDDGGRFLGCSVTEFRNGSEPLYCVLADMAFFESRQWKEQPVALRLPAAGHAYEVVTGKAFGLAETVRLDLPSHVMRIVAVLPGAVERVSASAPATTKPGDVVTVALKVEARPGLRDRQLARIEVFGPDGEKRPAYSTIAWIPAAGGEHVLPLALNDAEGAWRVRTTHVVSGVAGECAFRVSR